jgi:hypothetical protein
MNRLPKANKIFLGSSWKTALLYIVNYAAFFHVHVEFHNLMFCDRHKCEFSVADLKLLSIKERLWL